MRNRGMHLLVRPPLRPGTMRALPGWTRHTLRRCCCSAWRRCSARRSPGTPSWRLCGVRACLSTAPFRSLACAGSDVTLLYCAGSLGAVAASLLLALHAWPAQYAACRESLAAAELLATPCLVLLVGRTLPSLQPAALNWAMLQYACLARRVRLRTWAGLLLPLVVLATLASSVDCCKLHDAAPADVLSAGAMVRVLPSLLPSCCGAVQVCLTLG